MSIEVKEIKRVFRYNGISLPDVPGLEPKAIRDIYSAQYPELVSAEIEDGGIQNGEHVFTFRKAVGTKGAGNRMAALRKSIDAEAKGLLAGGDNKLSIALGREAKTMQARAWSEFTRNCNSASVAKRPATRAIPESAALAPVA